MTDQMKSDSDARIDRSTGVSLAKTLASATFRNADLMENQEKAREIRRDAERQNNIERAK